MQQTNDLVVSTAQASTNDQSVLVIGKVMCRRRFR